MQEFNFIKKYTFSDLFDGTFRMLRHTWKNTLIIGTLCLLPISLLSVAVMNSLFSRLGGFVGDFQYFDYESMLWDLLSLGPALLLLVVVSGVGGLFLKACIALTTYRAANGEDTQLKSVVMYVLKEKFVKLILQSLLVSAIYFGLTGGLVLAAFLLIGLFALLHLSLLVVLSLVLLYIFFIGLLIWLSVSLQFMVEALLFEELSIVESLKRSFALVHNNWWRVMGISLLISIIVSFAVSTLTGPISFTFMAPLYNQILENLLHNSYESTPYYQSIFSIYETAAFPLTISSFIQGLLSNFVVPVFLCLFYIDLRVRKQPPRVEPEEEQEIQPEMGSFTEFSSQHDEGDQHEE